MSGSGGDIIIKGGSVEIKFNEQTFPGQDGTYRTEHRKITSLEVVDDNTGETQAIALPHNRKCTIKISTM